MPKSNKIRIIKIPVGSEPFVEEIAPTLEAMQKIVGGYIEIVPIDRTGLELCCARGRKLARLALSEAKPRAGNTLSRAASNVV